MMWIIIVNSTSCRIFTFDPKPQNYNIIKDTLNPIDQLMNKIKSYKEMLHSETRLHAKDLASDNLGRYKKRGMDADAYSPRETLKEVELESFAREIVKELELGFDSKLYQSLMLVSPAKMTGLLHKFIPSNIKDLIIKEIQKDYNRLNERQVVMALKDEISSIHLN